MTCKIVIYRKPESVYGSRRFQIFLNGEKIRMISRGETVVQNLPPGIYKLVIKMGAIMQSNTLQIRLQKEEIKKFTVATSKHGKFRNLIVLEEKVL